VSDKDITVSLSCAGGEVIGPESWNPGFVGFRNNQKQVYEFKFVSLYDSATLQINPQVSQRVSYINLDAIEISLDKD
jgi:hypothetical protein